MKNTSVTINYDELLQLFVSTDQLHPHFSHPNTQEGYVYATDGHHIMRVPSHLVTGDYPNEYKGRFISIWPNPERWLDDPIQYDPQSIQNAILEIPRLIVEEKVDCDKCKGSGIIHCDCCGRDNDCNECDGDGIIATGKKEEIADPDYYIRFEGVTNLNARFLHNLLRCAESTGQPIYLLTVCDKEVQIFQTGEIEVGIMPFNANRLDVRKYIDVFSTPPSNRNDK